MRNARRTKLIGDWLLAISIFISGMFLDCFGDKLLSMRYLYFLLFSFFIASCIPISIAPNMKGGKVVKAKKFKRQLPKQYAFIFEDPKNANEFYEYVNAKFQVSYDDLEGNIPININDNNYYLTFYEVERNTETVNLIPMVVDAALEEKGYGSGATLESAYTSRSGTWYLALTVSNDALEDCLNPEHDSKPEIEKYAKELREEYLSTTHYIEVYLKSE